MVRVILLQKTVANYNTDFYYYENGETHFKLSKDSKFYKYA